MKRGEKEVGPLRKDVGHLSGGGRERKEDGASKTLNHKQGAGLGSLNRECRAYVCRGNLREQGGG